MYYFMFRKGNERDSETFFSHLKKSLAGNNILLVYVRRSQWAPNC